jgi:hypothetical protein
MIINYDYNRALGELPLLQSILEIVTSGTKPYVAVSIGDFDEI